MTEYAKLAAQAEQRMRDLFPATPLQKNEHLSGLYDAEIWLKREDLSPVRSYKLRGAYNAMGKQSDKDVFVCASAGNHAQGVAYVCRHMGKKGVIFMPVTTPEQKVNKTKMFGGENIEVKLVGDFFDASLAAAQEYCAKVNGHFLSPFDDPDVMEGQSTVTHEMLDQLGKAPDIVVVPVGGGGLSSSMRLLLSERAPDTEIFFVEPAGGASLAAAVRAGNPVTINDVDTFVDGAAVARIGENTFEALKGISADNVLSVPEDRICTTIIDMLNTEGIVLEPAGALAIDALKDISERIKGKTVVCVSSGGNFDFERLPEVKERAQRYSGVKKYYVLRLPQRPGALREFLGFLGPNDDVTRFEYLKKSARNFGSILIGIETTNPSNFAPLERQAIEAGMMMRDITEDHAIVDLII